ncbi:MAG TPA: SCO family protein [Acidimicrobiales bacterium]|nr:SCO family protein [Acidimicrobiales bacterium]
MQATMVVLLALLIVAVVAVVKTRSGRHLASAPPIAVTGQAENRALPRIPLTGEHGRPTSLAAYRGKAVVLAPVTTICTGSCPRTIAAFAQARQEVRAAGFGNRVAFVQVALDPGRDTPGRLTAFSQAAGISWPLLTGTPANLARLWRFLGVSREQVAPPPGTILRDWQTGAPVARVTRHNDAVYVFGPRGHLRVGTVGEATAALTPTLRHLLDREGVAHPAGATKGWTSRQVIGNVEAVLNQRIPVPRH